MNRLLSRTAVLALVLAPGVAAQPSFRALKNPSWTGMGNPVAVSDDGTYVAGATWPEPGGVQWKGEEAVPAPDSPRSVTPDARYLVGAGDPNNEFLGWQIDTTTGAFILGPHIPSLGEWAALAQSVDGKILLGTDWPPGTSRGHLFVDGKHVQVIEGPPNHPSFRPISLSGSGEVIGGVVWNSQQTLPVYWNGTFHFLPNPGGKVLEVLVSRDGHYFTGTYQAPQGERAFRADRHGNMHPLGLANFSKNWATCISADGDVIGGFGWQPLEQQYRAIVWNRAAGTRDLKAVLLKLGLHQVVHWKLIRISAMSGDGSWLVGVGLNPDGKGQPWIARIPPFCYANCDSSTAAPVLNVADFACFLTRFANGDAYSNCDRSIAAPILNVSDFACFLQQFAAGCPE